MGKDFNDLVELVNSQICAFSKQYQHVMLFVSGGVDSIVLFHVFCEIFKRKKFLKFSIFHVNYRLRGVDSENDFDFCRNLALSQGVEFCSYIVSDSELEALKSSNLQERARDIRYNGAKKYLGSDTLLVTAHHRSDLAENVIYRMARGCGVSGALGMSMLKDNIFRPFLDIDKSTLLDIANKCGFDFREDSSNAEVKYSRNRIRHNIMPELESIHEGASERLVETAKDMLEFHNFTMATVYPSVCNGSQISIKTIKELPPAVGRAVLRQYITQNSKNSILDLDRQKLGAIYDKTIKEDKFVWQLNLVESLEKSGNFLSLISHLKDSESKFNGLEAILDCQSEAEMGHSNGVICITNEQQNTSMLKIRTARLKENITINNKKRLIKELRRVNFPDTDPQSLIVMEELSSKKNQLLSLKNGRIERLTATEPMKLKINFSVIQ